MGAAEMTSESFNSQTPLLNKKIVFISAQAAVNSDFITVSKLTSVEGSYLQAADGTVAVSTHATNVITVTNASNLLWKGFAWGT